MGSSDGGAGGKEWLEQQLRDPGPPLAQAELDGWFATDAAELEALRTGRLTRARLRRLEGGCLGTFLALVAVLGGAWLGWTFHQALREAWGGRWPPWLSRPLLAGGLAAALWALVRLVRGLAGQQRRRELEQLVVQNEVLDLRVDLQQGEGDEARGIRLRAADGRLFQVPPSPRVVRVAGRYRAYWVDLAQLPATRREREGLFIVALEAP